MLRLLAGRHLWRWLGLGLELEVKFVVIIRACICGVGIGIWIDEIMTDVFLVYICNQDIFYIVLPAAPEQLCVLTLGS